LFVKLHYFETTLALNANENILKYIFEALETAFVC
jgi:hypothetical protein